MNRVLFEKIYEIMVEKRSLLKRGRKSVINSENSTVSFSFDDHIIEDIFIQFFTLFFCMIENLPDENLETIIDFINFPKGTEIEINRKLNEKNVQHEVDRALKLAMNYFSENLVRSFSEFMEEFIEETEIYVLYTLSNEGGCFNFSKTGRNVFNNKVKVHSRFANERMQIQNNAGRETKWTIQQKEETRKKFEKLKNQIKNLKTLYPDKKNTTTRLQKILKDFPEFNIYKKQLVRLLTGGHGNGVTEIATDIAASIVKKELNEKRGFRIKSTEHLIKAMRIKKREKL